MLELLGSTGLVGVGRARLVSVGELVAQLLDLLGKFGLLLLQVGVLPTVLLQLFQGLFIFRLQLVLRVFFQLL